MTSLRLYFLSIFFGLGAIWPLLGLLLGARGLAPSEYAWLLATFPLSRLIAAPLWGALADARFGNVRLLRVNSWISALLLLLLAVSDEPRATALCFGLWSLFNCSLSPLAEASTYAWLGARGARFGHVRVFGSLGFALSALGVGALALEAHSALPFWLAASGYAAAGLTAGRLPQAARATRAVSYSLRHLRLRADLILLWLASALYSAAHGAFDMYFGPHVRALGTVPLHVVPNAWGISAAVEIVVVWFMPRVLSLRAASFVLPACALVAALRWWLLAHVDTASALYLLAPLHGITFGAWYLSYVHEIQAQSTPELRATVQGIASACQALGVIAATVLGGYAFERWGGARLYELAALGALGALGLYLVRLLIAPRAALSPSALSGQD